MAVPVFCIDNLPASETYGVNFCAADLPPNLANTPSTLAEIRESNEDPFDMVNDETEVLPPPPSPYNANYIFNHTNKNLIVNGSKIPNVPELHKVIKDYPNIPRPNYKNGHVDGELYAWSEGRGDENSFETPRGGVIPTFNAFRLPTNWITSPGIGQPIFGDIKETAPFLILLS